MESYWTENEKRSFQAASQGQLIIQSAEGRYIVDLLRNECGRRIHTLVEIGTWNGLGSTLCMLHGIQGQNISSFHSIECNREKLEQARDNLQDYLDDTIHLVWGTILKAEHLTANTIEAAFPSIQGSTEQRGWLLADISNCILCPNVLEQLPQAIDFLLLDGGEFTTLQEFQILLPRCKAFIALDDTHTDKCREARAILRQLPEWSEIYCSDGRNGFSVFEKI
jgi:hypothetical protein